MYDFIMSEPKVNFSGFAVSQKSSGGVEADTMRGCAVRSLSEYSDLKDTAMLIVAAKPPKNKAMIQMAKDMGFRNICIADKAVRFDVRNFKANDGRFGYE
jgi:hypothetical protein